MSAIPNDRRDRADTAPYAAKHAGKNRIGMG
jgi:GGDEF domain-containing protein